MVLLGAPPETFKIGCDGDRSVPGRPEETVAPNGVGAILVPGCVFVDVVSINL